MITNLLLRAAVLVPAFVLVTPAAHADRALRPFAATLTTQETLGANPVACPLTILQGVNVGQGQATHMGRVTLASTDCPVLAPDQFTFTNGRLVLTAANGDTLAADYSGALQPTANPAVYALTGNYRVTGGTGRFAGATGSGTLQGSANLVTHQSAYTAKGVIGY